MTKRETIFYTTKEIAKAAAEIAPGDSFLGNLTVKYKPDGCKVSLAFGTDTLSLFIAADIYESGNVKVSAIVRKRSDDDLGDIIAEKYEQVLYYKPDLTRTDIKRWAVARFEKIATDMLNVFRAEQTKQQN